MIETTLYTLLSSAAALAALVGTRIYPVVLNQGAGVVADTLPAVTYQRISDGRGAVFCGVDKLPGVLFQIDCWGVTYLSAKGVAEAVRHALDAYQGTPAGGDAIRAVDLVNQTDYFEADVKIYRVLQEFRIWADES